MQHQCANGNATGAACGNCSTAAKWKTENQVCDEETAVQHQSVESWPVGPTGMSDIRRLAQRVISRNPLVEGVVLFGSRARKTAHQNSDWDVALLAPDCHGKDALQAAPSIDAVNYVTLSPKRLYDRCNWLGSLEWSVANDGILLAGEWIMPQKKKRHRVSYPDLHRSLQSAADGIDLAVDRCLLRLDHSSQGGDNTLSLLTQNTAEHVAKAALLHLAVPFTYTHNVNALADALYKKYPRHAWGEVIEFFNEQSAFRQSAGFHAQSVESIDVSIARLVKALTFYTEVLGEIARKRPGFARHLRELCGEISVFADKAQRNASWDRCPEELESELLKWNQLAKGILKGERN